MSDLWATIISYGIFIFIYLLLNGYEYFMEQRDDKP